MFKKADFEDEIYRSMEKQLVSNQVEDKHGFKRIAKAAEYLEAAAEIFDQAGMTREAEETISVLHSLAMENFSITDLVICFNLSKLTKNSVDTVVVELSFGLVTFDVNMLRRLSICEIVSVLFCNLAKQVLVIHL